MNLNKQKTNHIIFCVSGTRFHSFHLFSQRWKIQKILENFEKENWEIFLASKQPLRMPSRWLS